MRLLYSAAWWLVLPMVLGRLWWRGRKEPGYRRHIGERLGFYQHLPRMRQKATWIHAVSVGETRAAQPLVEALLAADASTVILLTHMTPTGRATGESLFSKHGARIIQCYLPYDTGWMTARFIRYFAPCMCILMETEVWPNLIAQCAGHDVPVALVNARLSERSFAKAQRFSGLMTEAASRLACVAAQTEADAARLRQLGARDVQVSGNIKFDIELPGDALAQGDRLRQRFGNRPVLLCASTREGEEELILDALKTAGVREDILIVIVPRHPQRFDEVARLIADRGFGMRRRSEPGSEVLPADVRILLGDSMGEMFVYYAACDVAFIGGSLLPLGGQNLIEACAVGKPVLVGPHTFNFKAAVDDAIAAGAAERVGDAAAMLTEAERLLRTESARNEMGIHALAFASRHRGATLRVIQLLQRMSSRRCRV